MKVKKMVISAIVIAALTIGAFGVAFAVEPEQSCCTYMQTNVCAQYMQGLTPHQRMDLDKDLPKKVAPAEPQYYPGGVAYPTGNY